jgi:hypothetical protein
MVQLMNLKTLFLISNNFTELEESRINHNLPNCKVSGDFYNHLKKSLLKEEILTTNKTFLLKDLMKHYK